MVDQTTTLLTLTATLDSTIILKAILDSTTTMMFLLHSITHTIRIISLRVIVHNVKFVVRWDTQP